MIDHPQLPTNPWIHFSAPSSGTASQPKIPKLTARTNSPSIERSRSNCFGPTKKRTFIGGCGKRTACEINCRCVFAGPGMTRARYSKRAWPGLTTAAMK